MRVRRTPRILNYYTIRTDCIQKHLRRLATQPLLWTTTTLSYNIINSICYILRRRGRGEKQTSYLATFVRASCRAPSITAMYQMDYCKTALVLCCLLVARARCQNPAAMEDDIADMGAYLKRFQNINVDQVLSNERVINSHIKCFLGEGPCIQQSRELKSEWTLYDCVYLTDRGRGFIAIFRKKKNIYQLSIFSGYFSSVFFPGYRTRRQHRRIFSFLHGSSHAQMFLKVLRFRFDFSTSGGTNFFRYVFFLQILSRVFQTDFD